MYVKEIGCTDLELSYTRKSVEEDRPPNNDKEKSWQLSFVIENNEEHLLGMIYR